MVDAVHLVNSCLRWTKTCVALLLFGLLLSDYPLRQLVPNVFYGGTTYMLSSGIASLLTSTTIRLQSGFLAIRFTVCYFLVFGIGFQTLFVWCSCCYILVIGFIKSSQVRHYSANIQRQNASLLPVFRNYFNQAKGSFHAHPHHPQSHSILAQERRGMESIVFDKIIPERVSFRQPGGNITRHPHLLDRMHICSRPFEGKDLQRFAAGNSTDSPMARHESCGRAGENCTERARIPYCVMSHVDYHLSPEQLCSIVTGPTFLIRHKMVDSNIGKYPAGYEARIRIVGDYCHMQVDGGQDYYHPYLDLGDSTGDTEGTIVSKNGIVSYGWIGNLGDTHLYYLFPHHGKERVPHSKLSYENADYRLSEDKNRDIVCIHKRTTPGTEPLEYTLPRNDYDEISDHLSWDPRTDGNLHKAYAYVNNRLKYRNDKFKYKSFLVEAILELTTEAHFSNRGRSFRVTNPWDMAWALPFYDLCLQIDKKLRIWSVDQFVDKVVRNEMGTIGQVLSFIFYHQLVHERTLPLFEEPETIPEPPPLPPPPRSYIERFIDSVGMTPDTDPEPESDAEDEEPIPDRVELGEVNGITWTSYQYDGYSRTSWIYPDGIEKTFEAKNFNYDDEAKRRLELILSVTNRDRHMRMMRMLIGSLPS